MTATSNIQFDYLVISPHFDDALVSLGQHILNWQQEGKTVKIIKVFTRFGDEEIASENGWQYLIKSGYDSVKKFEVARRLQDSKTTKQFGVEFEYLEYVDGCYRRLSHTPIYATSASLMSGHVSPFDSLISNEISEKITQSSFQKIIFPYGVGGHADNVMLRHIGDKLKKTLPLQCSFYLESPHLWEKANYLKYFPQIISATSYLKEVTQKTKLLNLSNNYIEVII